MCIRDRYKAAFNFFAIITLSVNIKVYFKQYIMEGEILTPALPQQQKFEYQPEVMANQIIKELPKFVEQNNQAIAESYLSDFGLTWKELRGRQILDVGAGRAAFALEAKKRDIEVTSVDIIPGGMGESGIIPEDISYVVGDFKKGLELPDESFDIIFARGSIHAMVATEKDLEDVLHEAKRLLKNGGEFRFGPGPFDFEDKEAMAKEEGEKLIKYYILVLEHEVLTAKETAEYTTLHAKQVSEGDRNVEKARLSEYERLLKGNQETLEKLQRIEGNVTILTGNKTRDERLTYYLMKK